MKLKITAKEAVQEIEKLVKKGDWILSLIEGHNILTGFKERREAEKRHEGAKTQIVSFLGKPRESQPSSRDIKQYRLQSLEWEEEVQNSLEKIYSDFIPKYKFKKIEGDYSILNEDQTPEYKTFLLVISKIEKQLNYLVSQYDDLITQVRSPLVFLEDSLRIVYYDRVVEITPNTDEESLCLCLFDKPIGQTMSYDEIHLRMTGQDEDQRRKSWRNKVKNAYEAVNVKTRKNFGFPIFESKGGNLLFIKILS